MSHSTLPLPLYLPPAAQEYRDQFRGSPAAAAWIYLKTWVGDALPANPLVTHETGAPAAPAVVALVPPPAAPIRSSPS